MKLDTAKPHSIHLRLTDEQYAFSAELANTMGLSVPDALRVLINSNLIASKRVKELSEQSINKTLNPTNDEMKAMLGDLNANDKNIQ